MNIKDSDLAPTPVKPQEVVQSAPGGAVLPREELPLQRIYRNERENGTRVFLTQPLTLPTQPVRGEILEWTWSTAVEEARRIAGYLKSQNWPPGSRIAIVSKNCAWWIMADFAIWMAGYTSVPIFPTLRDKSLAALLEHSQPVACFLGLLDQPPAIDGTPLESLVRIAFPGASQTTGTVRWADLIKQHEPIEGDPVRDALDIATIIYTSGTSGDPKGVMQTFQSLALMAKSMEPTLASDEPLDRMLSYLPLAHIAERAIVEINSLYLRLHIYFVESPETFLKDLARANPTIFFTVPRLLMRFQLGVHQKLPEQKLDTLLRLPLISRLVRRRILKALCLQSVRLAASGSAPLPVDLLAWYRRLGLNLIEGYGMTETGITHVPLPGRDRAGYVGDASPYAKTRISSEGEVQIQGPMNLAGYYRNPALTQASFTEDGYFRTGDRGEIDEDGRLRIVGRLKEEFKTSKGKYVIPAPLEQRLAASGCFENVCVLGAGMTGPFAVVVLAGERRGPDMATEARTAIEAELMQELQFANQDFEHHERLRFLVIAQQPWTIENGLLTPTLKVRRGRIEERFASRFTAWESSGKTVLWIEE